MRKDQIPERHPFWIYLIAYAIMFGIPFVIGIIVGHLFW